MVLMASKKQTKDDIVKRSLSTFKYSENGNGDLFEAVMLEGKPHFISYNKDRDNIDGCEEIEEPFRLLQAAGPNDYSYPPYSFKDKKDLILTLLDAKKQTFDTLLAKADSIISKYNDQDDYKLKSIASDVIWSYFQDRFATTRYEVLTGGVGSGKSALAATYGAIGYRPVNTTNPTAAVIYRLLGNIEPGQCTMILEEAEKIDQVYEIMAILKTGYTRDGKVDRTNPVTLKPEFFNSYCFKIIVAERSPNQDSGKGVIDRAFVHSCFKGYPKYDIKEILNPTNTGGPEHQTLRKELEDFRKLLLMYRLIHFKDDIADIDIGIIGRDKELVKPTLQLFQGTESQDKLAETFQTILDLKNKRKATSLHSALLDVASSTIPDIDKDVETLDGKAEISAKTFWENLKKRIPGEQDKFKPGEYHSEEFGTLYKGTVGRILHDNFGVESKHTNEGAEYTFQRHTIQRLKKQLESKISIKKVTTVTTVTTIEEGGTPDLSTNYSKENEISRSEKDTPFTQESSLPSLRSPVTCSQCGEILDPEPYWQKIHRCESEL